jgi:hypothetical protein
LRANLYFCDPASGRLLLLLLLRLSYQGCHPRHVKVVLIRVLGGIQSCWLLKVALNPIKQPEELPLRLRVIPKGCLQLQQFRLQTGQLSCRQSHPAL